MERNLSTWFHFNIVYFKNNSHLISEKAIWNKVLWVDSVLAHVAFAILFKDLLLSALVTQGCGAAR